MLVLFAVSPRTFALPDLPVSSEPIAIFTGNQSWGISSGIDVSTPPITQFWIDSLTMDITPLPGFSGVNLFSQSADGTNGNDGGEFIPAEDGGTGGAGYDLYAVFLGGGHAITTSGQFITWPTDMEIGGFGITAQSIGGTGGSGGDAGGLVTAFGGNGGAAWILSDAVYDFSGGDVGLFPSSDIATTGHFAPGIYAVSRAGDGGSGGDAGALVNGEGGNGGVGGSGGQAAVISNTHITTTGNWADGISANSLGGAGGTGGAGGALIGQGGAALGSGPGGFVSVINYGTIETEGLVSDGIFAQSVGGGGGAGGGAYDVGLGFGMSFGGDSTLGGHGGQVDVDSGDTSIITAGDFSHGISAMSVGGGGGSGGNAITYTAGGVLFDSSFALGGQGGGGGNGGLVDLTSGSQITTQGEHAHGLYAESIGGGGGFGGNAVA